MVDLHESHFSCFNAAGDCLSRAPEVERNSWLWCDKIRRLIEVPPWEIYSFLSENVQNITTTEVVIKISIVISQKRGNIK